MAAGAWGYCYGDDPAGEAQRAIETAGYGEADLLVLDVEAEFKGRAQAAEELCVPIRQALGPEYPLYFSSFAIARYHRTFPFEAFRRYCTGAVPQVYWNAFRWPIEDALSTTYEDYAAMGIVPDSIFPAGGLYEEGLVRYPPPEEVHSFIRDAAGRGSAGVSFWSYEHLSEEMWQAVGRSLAAGGSFRGRTAANVHGAARRHALRHRCPARPGRLAAVVRGQPRRNRPGPGPDLSGPGLAPAVAAAHFIPLARAVRQRA